MEDYKKYKEGLLYLFFGGLSFFISILAYGIFSEIFSVDVLIANIFAWIFSVSSAYITNRTWVFETKAADARAAAGEIIRFASGRAATLAVEEAVLLIFISWLKFDSMAVKTAASVCVVMLNYIVSKFWVFGS